MSLSFQKRSLEIIRNVSDLFFHAVIYFGSWLYRFFVCLVALWEAIRCTWCKYIIIKSLLSTQIAFCFCINIVDQILDDADFSFSCKQVSLCPQTAVYTSMNLYLYYVDITFWKSTAQILRILLTSGKKKTYFRNKIITLIYSETVKGILVDLLF